ncbi:hypothetical protein BJZ21_004048 [Nocardioides panaciterrulae]|uniref:Uncharacterized protein n=2 Tax=Nocardioides panaciterrulae TaxID=661492 RepID=A0A7Y9E2D1_9ACTN|nr:hypothetical protein [Nocardioides panaciterrulae]NYD43965.1 hypothetical protein [Nocardioides panaciterrulae]
MALLQERQAAYVAEHPPAKPWLVPLLEWFIRAGDELLFTPPKETSQPKRRTKPPRTYRSAASLRDERARLIAQRAPLLEPISPDRAASGGVALGPKRTARMQRREDSRLQKYVALTRRIDSLTNRIERAEIRERKASGGGGGS